MELGRRYHIVMIVGIILLLFFMVINIASGSVDFSVSRLFEILINKYTPTRLEYNILYKIRIPRMIAAIFYGGALAIAGFLMQTFFRNPIAGPYVLGISSGAKFFVGMYVILDFSLNFSLPFGVGALAASFIGSFLSLFLVLLFARKIKGSATLILVGIMIGYISSAGTDFLITFANQEKIAHMVSWSMGSFSGITVDMLKVSFLVLIPSMLFVFLIQKPLEGYLMGEGYAQSIGINVKRFRFFLILFSGILAAVVTAFAGPVSFVGLAVPHSVRLMMNTSKPKKLLPGILLYGALFSLVSDYLARTLYAPMELSISTITNIIGAPIVIFMLVQRRREL